MSNLPERYDPLEDALNIDTDKNIEIFSPSSKAVEQREKFQEYVDADYAFARENIMATLLKASDALDTIIQVADQSQAPRAYEVVSTLAKTIIDGNKDLLELAKKNKDLKDMEDQSQSDPTTVNNNLIVTTDQLQKLLKDQGVETITRMKKPKDEPKE